MRLLAPMSDQRALATPRHLGLMLDHARLRGMTPTERRVLITLLARLILEANGIATQEDGDDHA